LDDVKALADALGERRDPDVHLAQLDEFAGAVKEADRPGIEIFAERVRTEQVAGNEALAAALAAIEETDLRGRLAALSAAASPEDDPRRSFGLQRPGLQGPEADRRDAPRRAVLVRPQSARPGAGEGAARHAHRRQAPALHPRGRRRAVLRP